MKNLIFFNIICRIVLPMLTIIFILMPGFSNEKPVQSPHFDLMVRLMLSTFFCVSYWNLPNTNLFDPNGKRWIPIRVSIGEDSDLLKTYYIFIALGYGVFVFLFTFFAFTYFVPNLKSYRFIVSGLNGFVFILAFVLHYFTFKEKLESRQD